MMQQQQIQLPNRDFGNQNLNPNSFRPPGGIGNNLEVPPLLSLDKNKVSSYSYASKKAKKQHWLNRFKQNKKLETELLLKGYDQRKESRPFLLTFKGVSGIPIKDVLGQGGDQQQIVTQGSKFTLEYYVTLFNKDIGNIGSFYGKTYRSQSIPLRDAGGVWDAQQEEFVFFHTSYYEKSSYAVVECVIVQDFTGQKNYLSAGYALCSIFDFGGTITIDLIRGSPRSIGQLGLEASAKAQKSPGRFTFEMKDYPPFEKLRQLIPQNCFCGTHEDIPGLPGDKMPHPRSQGNTNQVQITLMPKTTLYIHNISMNASIAFENRFENFLRKMKLEKMRTARGHLNTNVSDNVYIAERRIMVTANNSWKNICEDAYVSMNPPNEQGVSTASGPLTLKNFICHPLVALVFRVEYKAVLPFDKGNEQAYFTLGWTYHVLNYNAAGQLSDEQLDTDFELGPGQVPTGDLLWDPNADDIDYFSIKMKALISSNPQGPVDYRDLNAKDFQRNKNTFGGLNQVPGLQTSIGGNQLPPKLSQQEQELLRQKEQQILEFKMKAEAMEKNQREVQQQLEALELQRLRDQQNMQNGIGGAGFQTNQNDQRYQEQNRLLQLQKDQMENELLNMRNDMRQYLESMKEGMARTQQQPGYSYGQPGYAEQFNHLQGQNFQQSTQSQIAMIGNVFYNMLNMIGESERDKRIIGLSDNLKKMVQQSRFDDLLAPKAPYVGMGQVNLLKTTDLPLSEQINFIKMGQGDLLQHPSAQITTSSLQKDRMSLELEAADPLKASTITFKFLCYKTPWNGLENLPSKFYFQLKFFTFPSIITDKVKIKNEQNIEGQAFRPGHTYYLSKENQGQVRPLTQTNVGQTIGKSLTQDTLHDPNLLSVVFEIDPSLSRITDEHMKLSNYLRERFLTVDIFDGESLFLYGTCKIPLYELMRQGRGTVVRAKECEMCDPDTGDFRGAIQLIMSNQGKLQSVSEDLIQKHETIMSLKQKESSPQKNRLQPSQNESSGVKNKHKKVVKSKPMDLTKMQQTNNEVNLLSTHLGNTNYNSSLLSQMNPQQISMVSQQNADLRKKLRVDRVKKMTMGHSQASAMHLSVEDPTQPDWAKFKSLREIEMIRETKKDQILSRVMDEYCTGVEQLSVIPGHIEFFKTTIYNPFNQSEVFTVHINDPDDRFLNDKELQLVTDQVEWRHWVTNGKCKRPFAYDIITPTGDVILKSNDEIELLFKYMTTRQVSLSNNEQPSKEIIKQRKIQVIILQSNKQPYNTLELTVVPSSSPIDHTFRFYEPQNSHVTLTIPPFLQLNHPGLCAVVSKPNATVDFDKDKQSFKIDTKTLEAPQIIEMTLFVYGDQFKEKVLATCQIELYSLVPIYNKIKAGIQTLQSLALPAESARQVQIFSNNHRLVYLPKRSINQTFKIIPQTVNHIQICAKTFLPSQQKIRIHCTDVNSGELVYQWLMVIDAEAPTITKKFDITCKVNHTSVQGLDFANRFSEKKLYEFASSRPDLVFPKMDAITFESREAKPVDLCFAPQPKYGTAEVFIYANDLEYDLAECYQLRITYLP